MLVEINNEYFDVSKISYISRIIHERFPLYYIIIDGIEKKLYNENIPREALIKYMEEK